MWTLLQPTLPSTLPTPSLLILTFRNAQGAPHQQPLKRSDSDSLPAAYYSPTSSRPATDNPQDPAHRSVNPWAAVAEEYPPTTAQGPSYTSTKLNLSSSFEDPTVEIDLGDDPPHVDNDKEAGSPSTSSTSHGQSHSLHHRSGLGPDFGQQHLSNSQHTPQHHASDGGTPSKLARKSSSSTGAGSSSGGEAAAAALSSTQNRGPGGPAGSAASGSALGQAKASLATDARGLLMAGGSSLFGAVVGGAGGSVFNAASSVFKHVASHVAGGRRRLVLVLVMSVVERAGRRGGSGRLVQA